MIFLEPEKIRVYKVKPWAVYFKHKDDYYLLHYGGELYEEKTVLYRKILDSNGNYNLNYISHKYGNKIPRCVFNTTYSRIDLDRFIYDLTLYGFIESRYTKEIGEVLETKEDLKAQIRCLQKEVKRLKRVSKMKYEVSCRHCGQEYYCSSIEYISKDMITCPNCGRNDTISVKILSEAKFGEWIPFTVDKDGLLNCYIPDEGQEILISDGRNVDIDIFMYDEGEYYLDGLNRELLGLAWMPLPNAWKREENYSD